MNFVLPIDRYHFIRRQAGNKIQLRTCRGRHSQMGRSIQF